MPELSDTSCRRRRMPLPGVPALAVWVIVGELLCVVQPGSAATTAPLFAFPSGATTATAANAAAPPTSATLFTSGTQDSAADARSSGAVTLQWRAHEGQRWRVEYAKRLRADTVIARGLDREKRATEVELRVVFTEGVLAVRKGVPSRVRRKVESARVVTRNPITDAEEADEPSYVGVDAEFQIDDMGALTAEKVLDGTRDAAEQFADESFFFSVLPSVDVREGDSWPLRPPQLSGLLFAIDASEGEAAMRFAGIDHPPGGGRIAGILGTLKALIRFREHDQAARFEGRYTEQFDMAGGFPTERRITGELAIEFETETDGAKQTVSGSGDLETTEQRESLDDAPAIRVVPDDPAQSE